MATEGSLNTTAYDSRYLEFSWSIKSQDVLNNKTTIYWKLVARGNGEYTQYNAAPFKVMIDTAQVYYSDTRIITKNGTNIANGEYTFTHNPNGTKTFSVYVQAAIYVYAYNVSGTKTFTLDTIPRTPSIISAEWENDEADIQITYANPALTGATSLNLHIKPSIAGETIAVYPLDKLGGTKTITLKDGERAKVWDVYNSRGTTRTDFYLEIVANIGGTEQKSSYTVSSELINHLPTVSLDYYFDSKTQTTTESDNVPIINFSTVFITITPVFRKGATLKNYLHNNGTETSSSSYNFIMTSNKIGYGVVDCRGARAYETKVFDNYCNYIALTCNQWVRTDWLDETTLAANVDISGSFYDGNIGNSRNQLKLYYRYCEDTEDINFVSWNAISTASTKSNGTYRLTHIINGLDYTKGYKIQCRADDNLKSYVYSTVYSSKTVPIFDWSENDFNFNVPIHINGMPMEYVVEQGTKDGWTYRKWSNGTMECWIRKQLSVDVKSTWGNLYTSGAIHATNLSYPFAFTDLPVLTTTLMSFGAGGILMSPGGDYAGSKITTGCLEIARGAAASSCGYLVAYHAIGKWK